MDPADPSDEAAAPGPGELAGQRREHVRVQLLKRCLVQFSGSNTEIAELLDLSGTGCGLLVRSTPPVGSTGRVRIEFETWDLNAPIEVRVQAPMRGKTYVGARFETLLQTEIDDIVREVFATMRRQIRNVRGNT